MVKVEPEFDEPIRERIAAFLVDVIDKIEESPKKNPDLIIKTYLKNYYERRKIVEHTFSNALLNIIKNDFILVLIEINKEHFENVSQSVMDELITFFIDFFIDEFYKYKHYIEITDNGH